MLLKVDGLAVNAVGLGERLLHAQELLRDAGHQTNGLVILTVRRQIEWKGIDVYYEVEVCVRKKMDLSAAETHQMALSEAGRFLECNLGSGVVIGEFTEKMDNEGNLVLGGFQKDEWLTLPAPLPTAKSLLQLLCTASAPFPPRKKHKYIRIYFSQPVSRLKGRSSSESFLSEDAIVDCNEVMVQGHWINDKSIACTVPDFEGLGMRVSASAAVRVQIGCKSSKLCGWNPVRYEWQKGFTFSSIERKTASDHQVAGYLKTMTDPYDLFNGSFPIFYWECVAQHLP